MNKVQKILKLFLFCSFVYLFICIFSKQAFAIYNPSSVPNNKFGIHILFTSELSDAAKLVNSNGGDWGYVTIPIQSGDKDIPKWQGFMDQAKSFHIIPIIRLATEGDYFNTRVWRKPNPSDVLDFANFLNSLNWPTKNRYIVVYNEVNRSDEWGGQASPSEYANILSYAVTAFKSRNPDFFVMPAGMDNAAADDGSNFNEYTFFNQMNQAVPGIFNQVDGLASHSYPNPAFSQPPNINTNESISSFSFEKGYIKGISSKDYLSFITETGWDQSSIPSERIGIYFQQAFSSVWNDPNIIAVTPFLLKAGTDPFAHFSLIDQNGNPDGIYNAIFNLAKVKGQPILTQSVLSATASAKIANLPTKDFSGNKTPNVIFTVPNGAKSMLKWFLRL